MSVRERPLPATWALLLRPTWLALFVRESKLLFVTEKGFIFQNDFFKEISGSMDNILYIKMDDIYTYTVLARK